MDQFPDARTWTSPWGPGRRNIKLVDDCKRGLTLPKVLPVLDPKRRFELRNFEPGQGRGRNLGGPAADLSSKLINSRRGLTLPRVLPELDPKCRFEQAARRNLSRQAPSCEIT